MHQRPMIDSIYAKYANSEKIHVRQLNIKFITLDHLVLTSHFEIG